MQTSREQLIFRVLRELKVLAAGQSPSAEDYQVVNDEIDNVMAKLARRNIIYLANYDDIPKEAFIDLSIYISESLAETFGKEKDIAKERLAERSLASLTSYKDIGRPIDANYF